MRSRILACSIAALLLGSAPEVLSQESAWIGTASGNWSVAANWQGGAVPVSGPDSTVRFTAGGSAAITSTNDLAAPFSIGGLRFENVGIGLFTVSGSALQLTGASPEIVQAGRGHVTLSTPLILNAAGGGAVRITGNGLGNLTIAGPISETGGSASLLIASQPLTADTQVITLSGANTSTGGITLESGNLALGAGAIGANNAPLIVKGGSLRFVQGASFPNPVSLHSDLVVRGDIPGQLGPISSAVAGTGLTMQTTGSTFGNIGEPRLTIAESSGYTGATSIDIGAVAIIGGGQFPMALAAGDLLLSGAGAIPATSEIVVRPGGGIVIDGTAGGGMQNRINDDAPIRLHGGILTLRALDGSAIPQAETVGAIKVGGYSTITVNVSANSTIGGQILASSLERTGTGTLFLRGIPEGPNPTAAASRGRVLLSTPPARMIGSGTGVKTPIVPYAIGAGFFGGAGLVTYTEGVGLRRLEPGEYATQFGVAGSNLRPTGSLTHFGDQTINSLVTYRGASLSGSGVLTISSGVVLAPESSTISTKLNFGATEGKIFSLDTELFIWDVTGSAGLTKAGHGGLRLWMNSLVGPLTITAGTLLFDSPANLGDTNSPIAFDGLNGRLSYSGGFDAAVSKDIILQSGAGWLIADGYQERTLHFSGQISGSAALILEGRRSSVIRLTGSNTMTGPIVLQDGILEINSDAALGSGGELSIRGSAASIRLLGDWITDRAVSFEKTTLDTLDFDAHLGGPLLGNGHLTKAGEGTLTLTSPLVTPVQLTVSSGTIALAGGSISKAVAFVVGEGAGLHSDLFDSAISSHFENKPSATISGDLMITGRPDAVVGETIGLLRTGPSAAVSLMSAGSAGSEVFLHADSLVLDAPGLMIRADNLGSRGSRLAVDEAFPLRSGLAIGVYTQASTGQPEFFTTYDSGSDASGMIGFRSAPHSIATTIQNPSNGGATAEATNVVTAEGGTAVIGASTKINSLIIAQDGNVSLNLDQVLRVETGSILARSGAGKAMISGGALDLGDSVATLGALRDLEISSRVVGAGSLLKIGNGKLNMTGSIAIEGGVTVRQGALHLGGANTYGGPTVVHGTLSFDSDDALGSNELLEMHDGNLQVGGTWITDRRIVSAGGFFDLFLNGNEAVLNGPLEGSGEVRIRGGGKVLLTAVSTNSGPLSLDADVTIAGSGSLSSSIYTTAGSLVFDNRANASSNRLRDDADISGMSPITLFGNADVPVQEALRILTLPALGTRAAVTLRSPGEHSTTLVAATFGPGSGVSTIAGDDLGGTSSGFTRVTAGLAINRQGDLLPNVLAAATADGVPESFAIYDVTSDQHGLIGVRPIRESEYTSSDIILTAFPTPLPNFLASSVVTLGSERQVINSLTMRDEGTIAMTPTQSLAIWNGSVLAQSQSDVKIEGGRLEVGSRARFIVNGSLALSSALSASGLEKYGSGTMRLGDVSVGVALSVMEGTLVLEGSVSNSGAALLSPATTARGATLAGSGDIEGRVIISGTLAPGDDGVGLIRTQYLTLQPASALSLDLDSATEFDRLEVAETLYLAGPVTLNLGLGFDPLDFTDSFTVISNIGSAPISLASGHFTFGGSALYEGSYLLADDQKFQISYTGGDGNDVVLRAVPEPSTSLLVVSGLVGFLSRRRRSACVAI